MKKLFPLIALTLVACGTPDRICTSSLLLDQERVDAGLLPANSCWVTESSLFASDELRIEEGVSIEFAADTKLVIDTEGSLVVEGTEENPALFFGSQRVPGFWRGIEIASNNPTNSIRFAIIEDAGAGATDYTGGALFATGTSRLKVESTRFEGNAGTALRVKAETPTVEVSDCDFINNDLPASIFANAISGFSANNRFEGNTSEYVVLSTARDIIDVDQTINALPVPYRAKSHIHVGALLTIAPGTEIMFDQNTELTIAADAAITAIGTPEQGIVFTGSDSARGFWGGIRVQSGRSENVFDYVTLGYAGSKNWFGGNESQAALYVTKTSKLKISNSTIHDSTGFAVLSSAQSDLDGFASNLIVDNERAVRITSNAVSFIDGESEFLNNDRNYVSVTNGESITTPQTMQKLTAPWLFESSTTIQNSLTIEAGATLLFAKDGLIKVSKQGTITALGTSTDTIKFHGAAATPGAWGGIEISSLNDNLLQNVDIRHHGGYEWFGGGEAAAGVLVRGLLTIEDSVLTEGSGFGLGFHAGGEIIACSNVDLAGNALGRLLVGSVGESTCR